MTTASESSPGVVAQAEQPGLDAPAAKALPALTLASLPRVNLIPPEIAEARRLRQVRLGLGGAVAASVVVVAVLYAAAAGSVSQANGQLADSQAEQTRLRTEVASLADVRAVYDQADQARKTLAAAMGQEVRWSSYLTDLSLVIPDHVWLTSMQMTQNLGTAAPAAAGTTVLLTKDPAIGTITFEGLALSHDDVAVWLETLASQKGFENPYFTEASETVIGTKKVYKFVASVQTTAAALSHRYDIAAGA